MIRFSLILVICTLASSVFASSEAFNAVDLLESVKQLKINEFVSRVECESRKELEEVLLSLIGNDDIKIFLNTLSEKRKEDVTSLSDDQHDVMSYNINKYIADEFENINYEMYTLGKDSSEQKYRVNIEVELISANSKNMYITFIIDILEDSFNIADAYYARTGSIKGCSPFAN